MIAATRALVVLITIGILLLHQNQAVELAFSAITFPPVPSFEASTSAARLCIDKVNEGYFEDIKLSTNITLNIKVNPNVVAKAISDTIEFAEEGHTLIGGYSTSGHAVAAGYLGITYGIAQLTDVAAASSLSNKNVYPYVSRSAPSNFLFVEAVKQAILHYGKIEDGWDNLAILSRADTFSIDIAITLINNVESDNEISVTTFQQFLLGSLEIDIELEEIKSSKSRLIFAVVFTEWPFIMEQADKFGLIGDNYVWIATSITLGFPLVNNTLSRGALGVNFLPIVESKAYQDFLTIWNSADPEIYPFAGADASFNSFQLLSYDGMLVCARAMAEADRRGILRADLPPETWTELIRGLVFEGATGPVSFDENSDRLMDIGIFYYSPEASDWVPSAIYSEESGYNVFEPVVWHSNTTIVPDLDIREPRRYWSCHDKESRVDKTGKTVIIHTPDGSDIDDIDIDYYCDSFIDCKNMSDESEDCSTNYKIVFIVFGIVAGVLILIAVALIVFVIIFGIILKYRRVRQLSPFFMLLVLVSVIIGYSSTYAWFGKPHPVGCAFQPWLLGLSSISMIAALSVKNFRIWRIFRFPMNKLKISDFELLTYWSIIMFPAVLLLIIWTIISTPTAKMQDRGDNDHYVCATGGFAGEYGGVVFFSILVAYSAFVLIVGAFVSFAIRNVPSRFNESKLLTISIYNLGFLAAVIIPVFLVVHPINPFIAWILRTCAILYAFTATMVLQFGPLLWGIFISDKGKNIRTFKTGLTTTNYSKKPDSESLSPRESGASSQNSVASIGT